MIFSPIHIHTDSFIRLMVLLNSFQKCSWSRNDVVILAKHAAWTYGKALPRASAASGLVDDSRAAVEHTIRD